MQTVVLMSYIPWHLKMETLNYVFVSVLTYWSHKHPHGPTYDPNIFLKHY